MQLAIKMSLLCFQDETETEYSMRLQDVSSIQSMKSSTLPGLCWVKIRVDNSLVPVTCLVKEAVAMQLHQQFRAFC